MGGGTIIDMGVYTIQLCQWVFQEEPLSIKAEGILNADGIDIEMSAELMYNGNKIGKIRTSALETTSCTAKITGNTNLYRATAPTVITLTHTTCICNRVLM